MKNSHALIKTFCVILTIFLVSEPALVNAQTADMLEQMMRSQRSGSASTAASDSSSNGATSFRNYAPGNAAQPGGRTLGNPQLGPIYQVHILGEVVAPGTYRVPASTRLSEAIDI